METSIPLHRVDVAVESAYVESQSRPDADQYVFAYTVTLHNTGQIPAKLLTRHWIITDGHGEVQEVRGDGVVGEQPLLRPNETFRYTSGAVLQTPVGSMHGSYQMLADDGTRFDAPIAAFSLSMPHVRH
jgi:ApaG protein